MRAAVLAVIVAACGGNSSTTADDQPQIDGGSGAPCLTERSPRAHEPLAFVGPTGLQDRMIAFVDSAQHTLDVQMYLFTVRAIADRIVAAKQRGVAVRVILDPDEAGNANVRPAFTSGGVTVRDSSPLYPFSHAKYLIADGQAAAIMSMNFNADAMTKERNYGIIDTDPDDVADAQAIFEMDWALAGNEAPKPADLSCTRLIVSPVNSQQRLLGLVNGAQHTLEVEALYVTETNLRNSIGAAHNRGVAVRVILEDPADQPDNTAFDTYLKNLNIPVHYVTTQFYLHAKLLMADDTAFVGSQNYSLSGLTKNREVGAFVFEPAQFATIHAQFEADWAATPAAN